LDNLTNLTHLTFGACFSHPLTNSLDNLTNLTHLTFGYYFSHPLTNLLNNQTQLKYLELGNINYNHQIELPSNIKILSLNSNNISLIDNLPNSIEELNLGRYFNLPCSFEILELPDCYTIPVMNVDSRCKIIKN
jgi:hypothetical protein